MSAADPFRAERPARLAAVRALLSEHRLDGILVQSRATSRYLSGFALRRGDESTSGYSGALLVTDDRGWILADSRYAEQAAAQAPGWELALTTGPLPIDLPPLLGAAGIGRLGVEADRTSHATWERLRDAAPGVALVATEAALHRLRLLKSPAEVEAIGRACALGDAVFDHLVATVRPGMTEREVARHIAAAAEDHGAEDLAFDSIVLVGARGSMPHGTPGDTAVRAGHTLLVDFGCQVDGYRSDMTRTVFVGTADPGALEWYAAVAAAQQAAIDTARVGVPGRAVHAAAVASLAAAGYPDAFGHGVGHGIGLETHEEPSLRSMDDPLEAGMVFSVEPGLYLPGRSGIRIEDIVVLEATGPRLLTTAPRRPVVVDERRAA